MSDVAEETDHILQRLDDVGFALQEGVRGRFLHFIDIRSEWNGLLQALAVGEHPSWSYPAIIGVTVFLTLGLCHAARYALRAPKGELRRWPIVRDLASTVVTLVVAIVVIRLVLTVELERQVARIWCLATVLSFLTACLLPQLIERRLDGVPKEPRRLARFIRLLVIGSGWALFGLAAMASLRVWNAGPGLRDVFGTLFVGAIAAGILIIAYWKHRGALTLHLTGPDGQPRWRGPVAKAWPYLAIAIVAGTFMALQGGATLGRPLPAWAMLGTLLLVLVAPHVDRSLAAWVELKDAAQPGSLVSATLRRMARFAFAALVVCLLAYLWALPGLTELGLDVAVVRVKAVEVLCAILVGALVWNAVGAMMSRLRRAELITPDGPHDVETPGPRSRLGTLLPLLDGTTRIAIFILTALTVLVVLEVNVWPLITGLSVFGLAIGFGSQTLVKDIVSGLFFLVDDAFRMGEYIETSGAKGAVERISVRSVSLRHPRGAIATIPYGQIGKIQNYSRDWVVEKLVFRVAFDTDVEKVRKLFKQIGQEIANDPELSGICWSPSRAKGSPRSRKGHF